MHWTVVVFFKLCGEFSVLHRVMFPFGAAVEFCSGCFAPLITVMISHVKVTYPVSFFVRDLTFPYLNDLNANESEGGMMNYCFTGVYIYMTDDVFSKKKR